MTEKRKPGFGSMDPEKQRAIARKGGKAAHAKGTAHKFTSEEAREAGRKAIRRRPGFASMDPAKHRAISSKGGKVAHEKRVAHEFTPEEAREAAHKRGQSEVGPQTSETESLPQFIEEPPGHDVPGSSQPGPDRSA
jgi:general stress protein YciG